LNEHFYCVSNDESSTTTSSVESIAASVTTAAAQYGQTKLATEPTEKVSSEADNNSDIEDLLASLENV